MKTKIGKPRMRELPKPYKPASKAVLNWMPYDDPESPGEPAYAMYSMLGYCDVHNRMHKVTSFQSINTGVDSCRVGVLECGRLDREGIF